MACTTGELESKEVVNVCDGRRFGCITDFELDPCDGKLKALFVQNGRSIFGKGEDIRIPWDKIVKIGEDTILVDIGSSRDSKPNECECCPPPPPPPKKRGRPIF